MTSEINKYQKLLEVFSKIPISKEEKTFMGICQYPSSRFEEICSRVLAFYFNPNEEHGFRDLWFRALNQCIKQEAEYCNPKNISLILEERTSCVEVCENKRIDILIESDSTVYAIENKIGAQLYNNLKVYSEHIEKKYKIKKKKIVLTAHALNSIEKQKASQYGFEEISYKDLFEQVNSLLGDYIVDCNVKQLTFMIDFMKTINNKMNFMENRELDKFFFEHRDEVDSLINHYNKWRNNIAKQQADAISSLYNVIKVDTNDKRWWIWQGWNLTISFNDKTNKTIGIEASYKEGNNNPLAKFIISITTWNQTGTSALDCWNPYENYIIKKYKDCYLDKGEKNENKRVYLLVAEIEGSKTEEIKNKLSECYFFLKELADKVSKS